LAGDSNLAFLFIIGTFPAKKDEKRKKINTKQKKNKKTQKANSLD